MLQTGLLEFFALEKQRLAGGLCERIRKTVSKIEPRLVSSSAVLPKRMPGPMELTGIYIPNFDWQSINQEVNLISHDFSEAALQHYSGFKHTYRGDEASFAIVQRILEILGFRLVSENRNER